VKILAILTSILGFGFQSFAQTDYTKILSDTAADMNKSKFSLSLSGGVGFRTGKDLDLINSDYRDFEKKLNIGYTIQFEPKYFITKKIGLGLFVNAFIAKATGDVSLLVNSVSGERLNINATQNDMMLYVGPSVSGRYFYDKFYSGYSFTAGVQGYQSKFAATIINRSLNGKEIGWNWAVGGNLEMGYNINNDFSIFIAANYFYNLISKSEKTGLDGEVTTENYKDEDKVDASRFGLGLGVNYRF